MADFCSGRVRGLIRGCAGWRLESLLDPPFRVSSWGRDEAGELYLAEWSTQGAGRLYRVVAQPAEVILADGFESGDLRAWSTCID